MNVKEALFSTTNKKCKDYQWHCGSCASVITKQEEQAKAKAQAEAEAITIEKQFINTMGEGDYLLLRSILAMDINDTSFTNMELKAAAVTHLLKKTDLATLGRAYSHIRKQLNKEY